MNMKKITLISVSIVLAASAFAWSKKSENTGNLGRMYVSIGGAMNSSKVEFAGATATPTGAFAEAEINAPIFKPGVNAFRKIKWAGVDGNIFVNYDYSGKFDIGTFTDNYTSKFSVGAGVKPYLNIVTGLPVLKAIKPFGIAYCGYEWGSYKESDPTGSIDFNENYFIYGVGGGVEFLLIDQLALTPTWQWKGNSNSNVACYQVITADLSYWFTEQFCVAAFWEHRIGVDDVVNLGFGTNPNLKHADIIGLKFRVGFNR